MVDMAVRALSCCCVVGDQTDAHQLSYSGENPGLDEGSLGRPLHLPSSDAGHLGRPTPGKLGGGLSAADPGAGAGGLLMSARTDRSAPSTARSLSPEEQQKEKERLQDMVKEFAKAAVQGQPCQWLSGTAGAPKAATYSFDKALRNFSVCPEDSPPFTLEMAKISEILKDVRTTPFADLQSLPPPHALAGAELERRFACVQHEGSGGGGASRPEFLGLLMPNPYERERFYTCMKILRWAMESRRERS